LNQNLLLLLETFRQYLQQQTPYRDGDAVLLAISGGVDSVVMAQLFKKAGIPFAVAHVNFGLRNKHSDKDEELVRLLAEQYEAPYFIYHPNTQEYAETHGVSIQMAARELRYRWFQQVVRKNKYQWIATAHHQNDVTETLLLNLTHGTGINGLHGILPVSGNLIRPLLFSTKEELEAYAKAEKLEWREDQSNQSTYYQRNFIRLKVIPLLKEINPSLENTIARSAERIRDTEKLLKEIVREKALQCQWKNGMYYIPESTHQFSPYLLHELLSEFGFSYITLQQFLQHPSSSGQQLSSATHTLYADRKQLILKEKGKQKEKPVMSGPCGSVNIAGQNFELDVLPYVAAPEISQDPNVVMLNADLMTFPLTFRIWKEGDRIQPLGMKGYKKVSDLLIDQKVPLPEKNKIVVVCSGEEVTWVVGQRISEAFKISEKTENILIIRRF
jgi:tRNA(Ile)-lysidine synthase